LRQFADGRVPETFGALDTGKRGGPEPDAVTLTTFGREISEA
jgi:hypothetical protein